MGLLNMPTEVIQSILGNLPTSRLKRIRLVSQKLVVLTAPLRLDTSYVSPRF